MPDPKAHQLYKQLPDSTIAYLTEGSTATKGWKILSESTEALTVINRTYIDLQGWSAQDLTTFTQGVDIQKMNTPLRAVTTLGMTNIYEFDILSTRRLTDAECTIADGTAFAPGFLPSTVDLMDVIYGERMEYGVNATVGFTYVQISSETFGSGNPTAMNRLHWTRIYVFFNNQSLDSVTIFPTNLVVQAITVEEADVIWFERLRRSHMHHDRAGI